jgi:hypothetical protein
LLASNQRQTWLCPERRRTQVWQVQQRGDLAEVAQQVTAGQRGRHPGGMLTPGLLGVPWLVWSGACLGVAAVYVVVWPRPKQPAPAWRRLVLRWAHALVWLALAGSCLLRAASAPNTLAARWHRQRLPCTWRSWRSWSATAPSGIGSLLTGAGACGAR